MPRINFGNMTNIGDKTLVSGISSGIDTKSIVENTVKAKEIPINKLKDNIDLDNKKVVAYNQLSNLLLVFQNNANTLRNPTQFDKADDIFSLKQTNVTTNSSTPGNAYLGVSATNIAAFGNYQITNLILANPQTQSAQNFSSNNSSVTSSTPTAGMFNPGTFQINGQNVTINSGDSLLDIQSSINYTTQQTNVTANIIQISSNNFQLILQSTLPGVANAFSVNDPSNCLSNINFTTTNANDASFNFNNIAMTRSTNTVSDIVQGVTFNLYQSTPAGTAITASVAPNPAAVENAITAFVGSYNDIKTFIATQNQRDPITNKFNKDSVLGGDSITSNIEQNIENEMMRIVNGITTSSTDTRPINLSEIGINFYDAIAQDPMPTTSNLLQIDNVSLATFLSTSFNDVKNVFGLKSNSSNSNFMINQTSTDLNVTNFTLNLDATRAVGQQAQITYTDLVTNQPVTINVSYAPNSNGSPGGIVSVPSGQSIINGTNNKITSPIDGINIVYVGSSPTANSNFTLSQGIAERIYDLTNDILDSEDGSITVAIEDLTNDVTDKNSKIEILQNQVKETKDRLLRQFSEVERVISKANSILEMLEANDHARRE